MLYPRLRSGSRILWRDLHATVGVYFALIVLTFLFSALRWASFWGEQCCVRSRLRRIRAHLSVFSSLAVTTAVIPTAHLRLR